jgi:hypothetical protein
MAPAGEKSDLAGVEMDLEAVAIEFDFTDPALARGQFRPQGCQQRFNEGWLRRPDRAFDGGRE